MNQSSKALDFGHVAKRGRREGRDKIVLAKKQSKPFSQKINALVKGNVGK